MFPLRKIGRFGLFDLTSGINQLINQVTTSNIYIFMEGSYSQLENWWKDLQAKFEDSNFFRSIPVCMIIRGRCRKYKILDGFKMKRISHSIDCGGVTKFQCVILINDQLIWKSPSKSLISWKFMDFIDPTNKGRVVDPPNNPSSFLFNPSNWQHEIVLPSVFSSTGWAERKLMPKEMYRILEFPISMDILLNQTYLLKKDFLSEAFSEVLKTSPSNVLMRILESFERFPKIVSKTETSLSSKEEPLFSSIISGNFSKEEKRDKKSVKVDNAKAPVHLWNSRIFKNYQPEKHDAPLEVLREKLAFKWYQRNLWRSFRSYMQGEYGKNWYLVIIKLRRKNRPRLTQSLRELMRDGEVGVDALERAVSSNWWEWTHGSTLFFWRWPRCCRRDARDGSIFPWKIFPFPKYMVPQKYPKNNKEKELVIEKVKSPIKRGYISPGLVKSLWGFFSVPKGDDDIRIVYDMIKCGLNACLWSPRFFLPVPESLFDTI